MEDFKEKRRHVRIDTDKKFRIFTSLTVCPYTVSIKNISERGAFINTRFIPKVNETISYAQLDENGMEESYGNARVVWARKKGYDDEVGFGIEMLED